MLVRINNSPSCHSVPAFSISSGDKNRLPVTVFYAHSRLQAGLPVILKKWQVHLFLEEEEEQLFNYP